MKKLLFIAAIASSSVLLAQEVATENAESVPVSDAGVALVTEAQEAEAPVEKKFKNAKKVLDDIAAEKGWSEGWDEEKGRIIVVSDADFKSADPKNDKDFLAKREMAAKRAVLSAKVAIIEMINSEMSASEMLDMPGTDVNKQLSAEVDKVNAALTAQQQLVADLLAKTDAAEAAVLRGTTFGQRLDDALAAAIKKLDAEYDSEKHDKAAKERFAKLKAEYEAASKDFAALVEKADKLKGELQAKQESAISVMAKMPLFGSTVILQTESWNDQSGVYQVAVMVTWSKTLERAARAIALGENLKTKPGKMSVNKWLRKQNLATMVGPRQYIDDKGNRWFLGVTARPYSENMQSVKRRKMKGLTEMFARQMATFCVFADVESNKQAVQAMETRGNEEESVDNVAESYAEKLSQGFAKKTIRGMQKLASDEVTHPITGEEMYVAVYGLNASAASAALEAEKINFATKIQSNRYQSVERGRRLANEAAVKASENRPEDVQAGANAQAEALQGELKSRKPAEKKGRAYLNPNQGKAAPTKSKKNTSGAFAGDTDVGDDF